MRSEDKTIEELYEEHLKKEPKQYARFYPELDSGIESSEYIKWKIEKDNLELVKSIPLEKRKEILSHLKNGNSVGQTAKDFGIENHMAVFYLINYNICDVQMLNKESI